MIQFQTALDAAPPGAVIRAADYAPFLKRDVLVTKPVTIIGGVFVADDPCGRPVLSLDGRESVGTALSIFDQDPAVTTDTVRLVGSYVFGPSDIRFDRLVLDSCRVYGDLRCYPGTGAVELTETLVQAAQDAPREARAGIGAQGATVTLTRSLVRGGRSQRCPSDGAPAVRSMVLGTDAVSRLRGGRGRCGGLDGRPWE